MRIALIQQPASEDLDSNRTIEVKKRHSSAISIWISYSTQPPDGCFSLTAGRTLTAYG
jgi:hypothetical protein